VIATNSATLPAIGVIPARGGSQGVPGKNLQRVGGLPLVTRAIRALGLAGLAQVAVTTDDRAIAAEAARAGAEVVARPAELAGPTASSESAILHALDAIEQHSGRPLPDVLVFAQATSPFLDPRDIQAAVSRIYSGEADVVFAAVESHSFGWFDEGRGPEPLGHPVDYRPRRQELGARYTETGGFYAAGTAGFRAAGYRFFGRLAVQTVRSDTALEIDSLTDLTVARTLAAGIDRRLYHEAPVVDALVMDFDGVHTDNTAILNPEAGESVRVNRGDGLGIAALRATGLPMLILTSETNPIASVRAAKLGLPALLGVGDKAAALTSWLAEIGVPADRTAYIGNDANDLPPMALVGWPIAVADAHPVVRAAARIVTVTAGGRGAVREVADAILAIRTGAGAT
jgi:N-acylneuraminate cytidylyltransferase